MKIDFEQEFGVNAAYVENLFERWQKASETVDPEWAAWFEGLTEKAGAEPTPAARPASPAPEEEVVRERLKGIASRIARNMAESLEVPTATSARTMPVKLLTENRQVLNSHMKVRALGKASFTHLIAFALVKALARRPGMQSYFEEQDGAPYKVTPKHVNLGLAIDLETPSSGGTGGGRVLVVPNIKQAERLSFGEFHQAYEDLLRRARENQLAASDFQDTTVTLTNPGGLGTHLSVPRLMKGQGLIIGTGAIGIPTHAAAMSKAALADLAVAPVMTVTSTYDHRVIQGAESGRLLTEIDGLLQGDEEFYDEIFRNLRLPWQPFRPAVDQDPGSGSNPTEKQVKVTMLIMAYRSRGARIADLDPLEYRPDLLPSLDASQYGLTIWDLDREFLTGGLDGHERLTLRQILTVLTETYCRRWTIEYMHIVNRERKHWLRDRVERNREQDQFDLEARMRILGLLYGAENFERFLHTRYVGNKRFSLEGADVLIPALAEIIDRSAENGVEQVVIGMAHRGRLNVLANILNKSYERVFREFEGVLLPLRSEGSGDVKYHLGQRGTYTTSKGRRIEVTLCANPSHLEAVDPVVCGMVRGHQDRLGDRDRRRVLSLLVHGDAAFAGQGVVAETLNMSNLPANDCGGTIHIVVNNQIGFTTGPKDLRSTYYCTDVAKGIEAPILHANGDYPESVLKAVRVSVDYHQRFHKDVVIDVVCYRRWGHNEGDEPAYTQPLLYRKIENHPTVIENYVNLLIRRGQLTRAAADQIGARFDEELKQALDSARQEGAARTELPLEEIVDVTDDDPRDYVVGPSPDTSVPRATLAGLIDECNTMPEGHVVHPNLLRQLRRREKMVRGEQPVDWGCAEALAFGSLLQDGVPIRINGQDSGRGTFSHRHAVIRDQVTERDYVPLADLKDARAGFEIHDSLLSEEAALAFEYGYSVALPEALTIWEAQFGDFANGAQIPIDQFITSSESKWRQLSGVTLLLPHGYDGMGPEHSSARIERFLNQCSEGNLTVANCSTSAQYFHLLRRQGRFQEKRPLIVFTPKSLLRLPRAASPISDLARGRFEELLPDRTQSKGPVRRLLLCSGKVRHDLEAYREERKIEGVAVAALEQLYPFPRDELLRELSRLDPREFVWCQEEPKNMGPWSFVQQQALALDVHPVYVGRPSSSSPATGSYRRHAAEQQHLVERAFDVSDS